MYECELCQVHLAKQKAERQVVEDLMTRLKDALDVEDRPQPNVTGPAQEKPRFYCFVCKEFIDPKNVERGPGTVEPSSGAVRESFAGYSWVATCHGETHTHGVTVVFDLLRQEGVVYERCHYTAFGPPHDDTQFQKFQRETEAARQRAATSPEHQKFRERLADEIANANAKRQDLAARIPPSGVAVTYDSPGIMSVVSADALDEETQATIKAACANAASVDDLIANMLTPEEMTAVAKFKALEKALKP